MHPNEILLVQRGSIGILIPTRTFTELDAMMADAPTYRSALRAQAARQMEVLK